MPSPIDQKIIQQLCTSLFHEYQGNLGFDDTWFGEEGWLRFCNGFLAVHHRLGWEKAYASYRKKAARMLLEQCRLRNARG